MSTLVKLLLALIIQLLSNGDVQENQTVSQTETVITGKYTIKELNPHYIITREELLSRKGDTANERNHQNNQLKRTDETNGKNV